jgi:hypothetical protein
VFDKPNKDDVLRSIAAVAANACQSATDERRRIEKAIGPRDRADLPWHVGEAIYQSHVTWLTEAMEVLANFLGQVDAAPMEMTGWVRPILKKMTTDMAGLLMDYFKLDGGAALSQRSIELHRRVDQALREFELGRINGVAIDIKSSTAPPSPQLASTNAPDYVSLERLQALREIDRSQFDLTKLIRLCEELNSNYSAGNYFSVAMLLRAILDHVPPIFSATTFEEVRANHGRRSFKEHMAHLDKSHRKMADDFLHGHVRRREVLPTETSIHFAPALDALLGEVEAKLR